MRTCIKKVLTRLEKCPHGIIVLFVFTLQALLEVHDAVAFKTYALPPASPGLGNDTGAFNGVGGQPIRMVGLHKQPNKPLVSHRPLDQLLYCLHYFY